MPVQQKSVAIDSLRANPWNTNVVSPENELKIEESVKRFHEIGGLFKPIIVREVEGEEGFEILGGEHRWRAAAKLGFDEVPIVNVGFISDKLAKEIGLADNARYGDDDALKLAELMKDLGDTADLQTFLPLSNDDLASIFAASTVALDDLDATNPGEMPADPTPRAEATHQIMRFKVPVEDVARITTIFERVMKKQGYTGDDSITNAGHAFVHIVGLVKPEIAPDIP